MQRAALAHIGIDQAPQADQQVLMHVAQRTGLDPFARQIYMIPRQEGSGDNRKTKWTIQTGIDGFRLIAERHPAYRGQVGPQWCGEDGVWRDVWLDREKPPAAARVGILRDDREGPVWGTAMFTEYAQTKTWNGQVSLTAMWRQKGAHMIAKCAEALAYRKAFPLELGGLHTDDEMAAADNPGRADRAPAPARPAAVTTDELTGRPRPRPRRPLRSRRTTSSTPSSSTTPRRPTRPPTPGRPSTRSRWPDSGRTAACTPCSARPRSPTARTGCT
ncbi:phage recombination protein Bet [Pseudonocardia alni]|uniref:phage recombination protein Bet n=1 Tax=Pseudonocardia alni TaxID=33907 RepID=UPI00279DBBB1|nr:phage recombination protein Bet [Pseudonocardia alni]